MPSTAIPASLPPPWPVFLGGRYRAAAAPETMSDASPTDAGTATAASAMLERARERIAAALEGGEAAAARELLEQTVAAFPAIRFLENWIGFWDPSTWPDAWLVAAVRREPPDEPSLDALAERHWKSLFARCHLLTLDREKAADLAQDAWCRILRARHLLRSDGNFPAYLATIATNLWRDRYRAERRAGGMADARMVSLDAAPRTENGDEVGALGDLLPDLDALAASEQARLKLDIDQAIEGLAPVLREVLIARFIGGESCADIGRRYGRTEQTVSGWVRQAVQEVRRFFQETGRNVTPPDSSS